MSTAKHRRLFTMILVLLGAAVYLAVNLHRSGRQEILSQFNAFQSLLAREAVHDATSYLDNCAKDLTALAALESVRNLDPSQMQREFETFYTSGKHHLPVSISVVDSDGKVVFSTRENAGTDYSGTEFFEWAKHPEHQGRVYASSWTRIPKQQVVPSSSGRFLLATPLTPRPAVPSSPPGAASITSDGLLLATLDLENLLTEHLSVLTPKPSSHRIWIMDQDGTILVQSEHPKMARENIHRIKPECLQCHKSFEYAAKMLIAPSGITEYQLHAQPMKLAAFARMQFMNASWVMVVNAPYAQVTHALRVAYWKMLLLLVVVLVALSLAFALVYQSHLLRVRAEEEAKQWQKRLELAAELQRRNKELEEALTNVKTLRGLLPICAGCKKIRDDQGYWQQVELYVQQHTEAEFTHSLCPECCHTLYPEIFPRE